MDENVRKPEPGPVSVLLGPEEVALATNPQVRRGDLETVVGAGEDLESLTGSPDPLVPLPRRTRNHHAEPPPVPPPHPAPQLVQLGQPESARRSRSP